MKPLAEVCHEVTPSSIAVANAMMAVDNSPEQVVWTGFSMVYQVEALQISVTAARKLLNRFIGQGRVPVSIGHNVDELFQCDWVAVLVLDAASVFKCPPLEVLEHLGPVADFILRSDPQREYPPATGLTEVDPLWLMVA